MLADNAGAALRIYIGLIKCYHCLDLPTTVIFTLGLVPVKEPVVTSQVYPPESVSLRGEKESVPDVSLASGESSFNHWYTASPPVNWQVSV